MMGSSRRALKLFAQLLTVTLLLIIHEPSSKLANGQLEAVGAIMSVVPVTSILATAGLVGVKLVALSRLLDVLGYDRAYLAQGGSGTAAHPIGLQTKYAYMFPYVPGLNISVQGDDSIGMGREPAETKTGDGPARKTYPAMGLPGDYERVEKPFRGSEALKSIFKQAGIQVHLPTAQQQQQLQHHFNLPPQEPTPTDQHTKTKNNNYDNKSIQQNQHQQLTTISTAPQKNHDHNPQLQPPQKSQQQQHQQPQTPLFVPTHSPPTPTPHVIPSNVSPHRGRDHDVGHLIGSGPSIADAAERHQQASAPSLSSSQSHQVPNSHQQHQQQPHQQQPRPAADAAAQVP